ncbi:MAG: hypothetical protein V8S86_01315 [Eubacteriales bacterium]
MSCKPVCRLCDRLVLSQAVAFTGGNLEINLPAGSYNNGEKYCIVVAQAIPETTTINAPVYVTIGTGTTLYPLTKRSCAQVTACGIRTRTRYSVCVVTTPTGGSFRMLGTPCCSPSNNLTSIDGGAAPAPTA